MTVSSEMENRIDDSSSTDARSVREPHESLMPWVETVMYEGQQLLALQIVRQWSGELDVSRVVLAKSQKRRQFVKRHTLLETLQNVQGFRRTTQKER